MVSFVCDYCQETIKKPKLDQHKGRCRQAQFTCVDCSVTFQGTEYRQHSQCISEAEKYQKALYQPKKGKQNKPEPKAAVPENKAEKLTTSGLVSQIKSQGTEDAPSFLKKAQKSEQTSDTAAKTQETKDEVTLDKELFTKSVKSVLKKHDNLSMSALKAKAHKKYSKKSKISESAFNKHLDELLMVDAKSIKL